MQIKCILSMLLFFLVILNVISYIQGRRMSPQVFKKDVPNSVIKWKWYSNLYHQNVCWPIVWFPSLVCIRSYCTFLCLTAFLLVLLLVCDVMWAKLSPRQYWPLIPLIARVKEVVVRKPLNLRMTMTNAHRVRQFYFRLKGVYTLKLSCK